MGRPHRVVSQGFTGSVLGLHRPGSWVLLVLKWLTSSFGEVFTPVGQPRRCVSRVRPVLQRGVPAEGMGAACSRKAPQGPTQSERSGAVSQSRLCGVEASLRLSCLWNLSPRWSACLELFWGAQDARQVLCFLTDWFSGAALVSLSELGTELPVVSI